MKKYKLTDDTIAFYGKTLYRIQALRDFGGASKGDLGGYIESEDNLSHFDNAWVYGNARVSGNAWVYGNADVFGNAMVYENARVSGNAKVPTGTCTSNIINLINLCQFNITVYNNHIIVGCKHHTKKEWARLLEDNDLYLDECSNKKEQQKLHFYITSLLMD